VVIDRLRVGGEATRASTVVLTAAGEKKIRSAAPGHAQLVQELVVEPLSPMQLQQLGEAAATVVQAIDIANRARKRSDALSPDSTDSHDHVDNNPVRAAARVTPAVCALGLVVEEASGCFAEAGGAEASGKDDRSDLART
jgi:hypothetical protein